MKNQYTKINYSKFFPLWLKENIPVRVVGVERQDRNTELGRRSDTHNLSQEIFLNIL